MTAPEPTRPADEHIDAVARAITVTTRDGNGRRVVSKDVALTVARAQARALLTSTDPRVHEALAANLPADVMLAALVRAGVLVRTTITANNATVSILAERIEVAR